MIPALTQPYLPYRTDALSPVLEEPQVRIHFELYHKAYYDRARALLRKKQRHKLTTNEKSLLAFNLNGNALHQLWWDNLTFFMPGQRPRVPRIVLDAFGGNARALKKEIVDTGSAVEGSGWVGLSVKKDKPREAWVHQVHNHDYDWGRYEPLLLIDVFEHSYIFDYLNARRDYLGEVLGIVNWGVVADRLETAR